MILNRLGEVQRSALVIYVFDPVFDDEPFPGTLDGSALEVTDPPGGGNYCCDPPDLETCGKLGMIPWCCTNQGGHRLAVAPPIRLRLTP